MTEREIDALVAEKLMGWKYEQHAPEGHHCHIVGDDKGWWKAPGWLGWSCAICNEEPPHYSTNIADAWQVVEKLKETFGVNIYEQKGFQCTVELYYDTQGVVAHTFASGDTVAVAKTTPMAICLAALKSLGVEIE